MGAKGPTVTGSLKYEATYEMVIGVMGVYKLEMVN